VAEADQNPRFASAQAHEPQASPAQRAASDGRSAAEEGRGDYLEPHVAEALGHGGRGPAAARGELASPDLAALQLGGGVKGGRVEAALPAARASPGTAAVRAVAAETPPARRDAEAHPQLPLGPVHPGLRRALLFRTQPSPHWICGGGDRPPPRRKGGS
jgi:hypothetical protein